MRQVQIDGKLFADIYNYISEKKDEKAQSIFKRLDRKVEKLAARETYSEYKKTTDKKEKEALKNDYIRLKGNTTEN